MAEGEDKSEKTEEPTDRKLRQAREKGDVPKSQEVASWFLLAAGLAIVAAFAPALSRDLAGSMSMFLSKPHALSLDPAAALDLVRASMLKVTFSVALVMGLLIVAGAAGHLVQHGLLFAPSKLEPKLSKLNPVEGLKRMFGPEGLANFAKGVAKIVLVAIAIFLVMWPHRGELAMVPRVDVAALLALTRDLAIELLVAALIVQAFIAAADFMFQKHQYIQRNKMSRKEIRDEFKDTEGDPMVRAKLRQIRMERAQRRMLSAVPDATVVITNPTHYAVALKYEQGVTPAPVCVAKGVDAVALRIREAAETAGVPVVEDPPLARALHATVDLDEAVPPEQYQAVAKVIGYVLSLAKGRAKRGPND